MDRKEFIRLSAAGAGGALLGGAAPFEEGAPAIVSRRGGSPEVVVIGAGAFGGWTAYHLRRKGASVTLLDAYGPGNSRSSSGGETRLTQVVSPDRPMYMRMALRAFEHWMELQERTGRRIVLETGRLAMYRDPGSLEWVRGKIGQMREHGITDAEVLSPSELANRWPQINTEDIEFALFTPGGAAGSTLLARQACQIVAAELEREGGEFRQARAVPDLSAAGRLPELPLEGGESLGAQEYVFACGPWLHTLFPDLLGSRLQVQRRDVLFIGVPPGDDRFSYPNLPEWSVQGSGWYGFPDIEGRGLKAAPYPDLNTLDPDSDERLVMPQQVKRAHDFIGERFPALRGQPVIESRVCQVTNTDNSDFIVDRHPELANVWIVGGGSGHGFKHGPALGEYVAQRVMGEATDAEYNRAFALRAEEPF